MPIRNTVYNSVEFDGSQYGMESMKAYHNITNKWMGRVYVYTWEFTIRGMFLASDAKIKLQYHGSLRGQQQSQFRQVSGGGSLVDLLNKDAELIQLCNTLDFGQVTLKYNHFSQKWTVRMMPNYRDFTWVLIPPMSYARIPTSEEARNTLRFMELMAIHIEHQHTT